MAQMKKTFHISRTYELREADNGFSLKVTTDDGPQRDPVRIVAQYVASGPAPEALPRLLEDATNELRAAWIAAGWNEGAPR